jgi:5'-nucleotidase
MLVIGISSRALFDLEEEERIYNKRGLDDYRHYQLEHEDEILDPGTAFPLIKGLLSLNKPGEERVVEVIVVSRNHPETGLRVFHSIRYHHLDISRAAFVGGAALVPYLHAFKVDLFLSRSKEDAQEAIDGGIAAGVLYNPSQIQFGDDDQLRIAFDADAVVFSEESEAIYRAEGLEAFLEHESSKAEEPLPEGPLATLLRKLCTFQEGRTPEDARVRLGIFTARNSPAHERVIKTLRRWGVRVDEAFFLGGIAKDQFLEAFGAHIFFDDQEAHLAPASRATPSALVLYRTTSVLRVEVPSSPPHVVPTSPDEVGEREIPLKRKSTQRRPRKHAE